MKTEAQIAKERVYEILKDDFGKLEDDYQFAFSLGLAFSVLNNECNPGESPKAKANKLHHFCLKLSIEARKKEINEMILGKIDTVGELNQYKKNLFAFLLGYEYEGKTFETEPLQTAFIMGIMSNIDFYSQDPTENTLIPISEYAEMHNVKADTIRQRINRGQHETAHKKGSMWFINKDEPYVDNRVKEEEPEIPKLD